jgi:hypothetical protein
VVQVDPIKPTLKAPGTKRLKLDHDEPLSNFAFKINLRHYKERARVAVEVCNAAQAEAGGSLRTRPRPMLNAPKNVDSRWPPFAKSMGKFSSDGLGVSRRPRTESARLHEHSP